MWGWRRRTDEDFGEEIQANITLDVDRFIAEGMGPEEARAAALRAFGNVTRTQEIGIRMALGAARHRIAWMLARETLIVLMVGVGLGIAGHLAAAQLIQSQLFGVEPSDPTAAAAAVAGLALIAAVAVWLPARRATKVDPMVALRWE